MRYFFVLLIIFNFSYLFSQSHYIDPRNLSWQDFRGLIKPDSGFIAYSVAKVYIDVQKKDGEKAIYRLGVDFFPDSSWVDWSAVAKLPKPFVDSLFEHELMHYYIAIIVFKEAKSKFPINKYWTLQ